MSEMMTEERIKELRDECYYKRQPSIQDQIMRECIDTIDALQEENERLQRERDRYESLSHTFADNAVSLANDSRNLQSVEFSLRKENSRLRELVKKGMDRCVWADGGGGLIEWFNEAREALKPREGGEL